MRAIFGRLLAATAALGERKPPPLIRARDLTRGEFLHLGHQGRIRLVERKDAIRCGPDRCRGEVNDQHRSSTGSCRE